jgi:ergothioneine biosynthesis protein EgtB
VIPASPAPRNPANLAIPAVADVAARFSRVRAQTLALTSGLSVEDLGAQSMPDASPGKWHLGHTTWFFEAMVLVPLGGQPAFQPAWHYLFNSYYDTLGERHPRAQRGLLTRPTLDEILAWRAQVDERILSLLLGSSQGAADTARIRRLVELGTHHEQQHQELLVTDVKHLLSLNALAPAWRETADGLETRSASPPGWIVRNDAGPLAIGHAGNGFAFDNEGPRHMVWLAPFALADRPVSNLDYLKFIEDGGYEDPRLWLADGWAFVQSQGLRAPLYWRPAGSGTWQCFTVAGLRDLAPAEPVVHLSFFEADAYARWADARLPTEAEWESVAATRSLSGEFADSGRLHPGAVDEAVFGGHVWEWTASAYDGYPGFRPAPGAVGEYNGKFMSGQMILRGGSCATPRDHIRATYRNFFPPSARWQFSGLRLARDL